MASLRSMTVCHVRARLVFTDINRDVSELSDWPRLVLLGAVGDNRSLQFFGVVLQFKGRQLVCFGSCRSSSCLSVGCFSVLAGRSYRAFAESNIQHCWDQLVACCCFSNQWLQPTPKMLSPTISGPMQPCWLHAAYFWFTYWERLHGPEHERDRHDLRLRQGKGNMENWKGWGPPTTPDTETTYHSVEAYSVTLLNVLQ